MQFYADEDFALPVVAVLRQFGHDVITVQEDGRTGLDDLAVLSRAHAVGRVLLTHNRRHFERLHRQGRVHNGVVTCTRDKDFAALAARIHQRVGGLAPGSWCLRINRGS